MILHESTLNRCRQRYSLEHLGETGITMLDRKGSATSYIFIATKGSAGLHDLKEICIEIMLVA
jgi:hypothetical protein